MAIEGLNLGNFSRQLQNISYVSTPHLQLEPHYELRQFRDTLTRTSSYHYFDDQLT